VPAEDLLPNHVSGGRARHRHLAAPELRAFRLPIGTSTDALDPSIR
jgi:hypothetical protein